MSHVKWALPSSCVVLAFLIGPHVLALITENEGAQLPAQLQRRAAEFPLVEVTGAEGRHQFFSQVLNNKPVVLDGKRIDAVRFRTPKTADLDLVWLGMLPDNGSSWYVMPVVGKMEGFHDFVNVNGEYEGVPWKWSSKQTVFLQDLSHTSLKPDTEYLLWYEFADDKPATVQGAINFVPATGKEWTREALEKALGLEGITDEARAARLQTRGVRILRDKRFFGSIAAGEVSMLVSLLDDPAQAISIQTDCPFQDAHVSIEDIEKIYGPADVVFYHDQMAKIFPDDSTFTHPTYATYYFDYVGFVVDRANPRHEVIKDHLQPRDYSVNQKQRPGLAYDTLDGYDFEIFYQDGRELARVARLGEGPALPLSGKLVDGIYRQYGRGGVVENEIEYHNGSGIVRGYNPARGVQYEVPFVSLLFQGEAKFYDPEGWVAATAAYENGKLNGPYSTLDKNGNVTGTNLYKDGVQQQVTGAEK